MPGFKSPFQEESTIGMRNDSFACTATSSQLLNQKIQVNKCKSFSIFVFKTVL